MKWLTADSVCNQSEKSQAFDFIIEGDTLIPPFISVPGLGENVAKRIVEAREDGPFLSKEDLNKRLDYLKNN